MQVYESTRSRLGVMMTTVYAIVNWRTHEVAVLCETREVAEEVLAKDFNYYFNAGYTPMEFFPPYEVVPMDVAKTSPQAMSMRSALRYYLGSRMRR